MTVQRSFFNWSTSGLDPLAAPYNSCSPNLVAVRRGLDELLGPGEFKGCHNDRPVRDGTALSAHSWGAALDRGWAAGTKDATIRFLIDHSAELGVQAIHDYAGSRIWRAGRTADVGEAHTLWWRSQAPNTATGMGQSWAQYLHIETTPAKFGDATPIAERIAPPPPDLKERDMDLLARPARVYSTRPDDNRPGAADGPLAAGARRDIDIPYSEGARQVLLVVKALPLDGADADPTSDPGWLSLTPPSVDDVEHSDLNWNAGDVVAPAVPVEVLVEGGRVRLHNGPAACHVIVDFKGTVPA
jgi:hypothetical protein